MLLRRIDKLRAVNDSNLCYVGNVPLTLYWSFVESTPRGFFLMSRRAGGVALRIGFVGVIRSVVFHTNEGAAPSQVSVRLALVDNADQERAKTLLGLHSLPQSTSLRTILRLALTEFTAVRKNAEGYRDIRLQRFMGKGAEVRLLASLPGMLLLTRLGHLFHRHI